MGRLVRDDRKVTVTQIIYILQIKFGVGRSC